MLSRQALNIILALLTFLTGISAGPLPQAADRIFIKETGHWISGEFYYFWREAPDPTLLFGYPITEAIPHPYRPGVTVQYFQRARLEMDPSLANDEQIQLASLGAWLYDETQRGEPANFPVTNGACRSFTETGNTVCYAFLQFYDRLEGPFYFGLPISNAEYVDGRLVQYFERARMEWRPEMPAGQRVILTEIGRLDFDISIGDPNIKSSYRDIPQNALTEMQVYAFAAKPVMPSGDQQKVYTVIYDQFQQPLKDVQVMITVEYPDGRQENFRPDQLTGADGLAFAVFNVDRVDPNQVVQIRVEAKIPNGPSGGTATWFRIWW